MRTSGEVVLSPCRPDEAESGPRGSDEVESGPQGSDEAESVPRGSDEAESLHSCSIGNVVGAYQLYLIGYPSIRSPIVAPEPLGDSGRIARVLSRLARECSGLPEGARERTRWV